MQTTTKARKTIQLCVPQRENGDGTQGDGDTDWIVFSPCEETEKEPATKASSARLLLFRQTKGLPISTENKTGFAIYLACCPLEQQFPAVRVFPQNHARCRGWPRLRHQTILSRCFKLWWIPAVNAFDELFSLQKPSLWALPAALLRLNTGWFPSDKRCEGTLFNELS
jgi:hypothetical protein